MNKTIAASAVAIVACGLAGTPAQADSGTNAACALSNPCVFDRNNKPVGVLQGTALRKMLDTWYQVDFNSLGVRANALFYYASDNCTGTPYISDYNELPTFALYDGQRFYAPTTPAVTFEWASYSYPATPEHGGQCFDYGRNCQLNGNPGYCTGLGGPATLLQTVTFSPPLRIRFGAQ